MGEYIFICYHNKSGFERRIRFLGAGALPSQPPEDSGRATPRKT
jgi:hypothetical protein